MKIGEYLMEMEVYLVVELDQDCIVEMVMVQH
jgi:hypothetical protein